MVTENVKHLNRIETVSYTHLSKVTEKFRPLKAGDYYMQDGSILPGDEDVKPFRDELRKSCLGVVFWVGEIEGKHWTQTGTLAGDRLLRCV